ncbi:hypothetical protein NL676_029291 [Syzygium grande]|nr:hypothetical protein NL676_029291 [Syzygium grande]
MAASSASSQLTPHPGDPNSSLFLSLAIGAQASHELESTDGLDHGACTSLAVPLRELVGTLIEFAGLP